MAGISRKDFECITFGYPLGVYHPCFRFILLISYCRHAYMEKQNTCNKINKKKGPQQRFQPVKCNMKQLTRKWIKKIHATCTYTLMGTMLENKGSIKYLGVTDTSVLRWKKHVSNICTEANRMLGFFKWNLLACTQNMKKMANKRLGSPVLEYASSVWIPPPTPKSTTLWEKVQNRAARFVTRNFSYENGSMTGILQQPKWESLVP